jgi:hypothetical protein
MPRVSQPAVPVFPTLDGTLFALNVDDLKWYLGALPGAIPARKPELVAALKQALTNQATLQSLLAGLSSVQQQVLAEVVHQLGGQYNTGLLEAKYPDSPLPKGPRGYSASFYVFGGKKEPITPFDVFFFYNYELGRYIPSDLAARLRELLPAPAPAQLASQAKPPAIRMQKKYGGKLPELMISEAERTIFHDLSATLYLIQQGKAAVSAATRLPTLPALRLLRQNLLLGDYFDGDYERAEDAIRPLALIVLVQAAKWAQPTAAGNKLELTRAGQGLLGAPLGAQHVRDAYTRWLKSDLLDELGRVRNIKGQQAKGTYLTKPAERRAQLDSALHAFALDRWVTMDELLRYMRASNSLPAIERGGRTALGVGAYNTYYDDEPGFSATKYWDVITGSYLRAALLEYVATLGLVEIAYTRAEDTPHDFGRLYYLDGEPLSRYDGLLALRLTNLGAYVLGLADEYTPPALVSESGAPILKVLPNLDLVITDAARIAPNERSLLERIAAPQSQDVYRLNREQLLEAANSGLDLAQIKQFLSAKSGQPESEFPQIVRVFFEDLEKRLGALRELGTMLVLAGDDQYVLTELAHNPALRAQIQLGTIGDQTVLLIPEQHEASVRKQLKKLGYLPRKS